MAASLSFFYRPRGSPTLGTSALFAQFKASSILKCSVGAHSQLVWNRQRRDICPIYSCILTQYLLTEKSRLRLPFRFPFPVRAAQQFRKANRNNSSNQSVIKYLSVLLLYSYTIIIHTGVSRITLRSARPAFKTLPGTFKHGQDFKNTKRSKVMQMPRLSLPSFFLSKCFSLQMGCSTYGFMNSRIPNFLEQSE